MTSDGRPAASWFPDPLGRHEHRFWDGERWTVHVADNGVTGVDGGAQQPVVQQPVVQQPVVQQPVASQPAANETVIPERRQVTPQSQPAQPAWTPQSGWQTAAAATPATPYAPAPTPAGSSVAKVWIFAVAFLVAVAGIGLTAMLALGGNRDTSSASGEQYPAIVETNFMNSCTATGGTTSYCRCALDHLEQDTDLEEFAGMEQEYLKTGQLPESVMSAVRACVSQQVTP